MAPMREKPTRLSGEQVQVHAAGDAPRRSGRARRLTIACCIGDQRRAARRVDGERGAAQVERLRDRSRPPC